MNLLERLMPKRIQEELEERERATEEVVETSRKKRRNADSEVIKAYRSMGKVVRRHDWSD